MQHVLELLKLTQHKAWKDIIISQENLQAWPEDGDIATDFQMMVLTESEDGHVIYSEGTDDARLNDDTGGINDGQQIAIVNNFGGGRNTGPAPLQNVVIPDETVEGVVNVVDQTDTGGGNGRTQNEQSCAGHALAPVEQHALAPVEQQKMEYTELNFFFGDSMQLPPVCKNRN